ncbi:MAG: hypothetical protein M1813_004787 [Trichoglossum hirsutum]|nr:MAG: hypothetical protein M1813_004787 [Trichoglossum hirsutum]
MRVRIEERGVLPQLLHGRQVPIPPPSTPSGNPSSGGTGSGVGGGSGPNMKLIIVSISILLTFIVAIVSYSVLRHLRLQQKSSRYVPTAFLKRKWDGWNPSTIYAPAQGYDGVNAPSSSSSPSWNRRRTPGGGGGGGGRGGNSSAALSTVDGSEGDGDGSRSANGNRAGGNAPVDRNTSVRSVMTLPAYNPNPRENERVLGREGERGGIDMVVEFPETTEEEETRREEEMEALYQVRLARRAEIAQRQERARLRREARDRGDWATYEALRAASRQRAAAGGGSGSPAPGSSTTSLGSTVVTADAAHRERDRRVTSVSYAAVGLARHDGTRVRANSSESERPLLSSAASMGGQSSSTHQDHHHGHGRAASLLSVSTSASVDDSNHPNVTEVIQLGTRSSQQESDVGEQRIPSVDPPRYDDFAPAPPYESPIRARAPLLPAVASLPAIEVTGTTPIHSRAVSPVGWEEVEVGGTGTGTQRR